MTAATGDLLAPRRVAITGIVLGVAALLVAIPRFTSARRAPARGAGR